MRAEPGTELACRGHNYNLPPGSQAQPRGVLSYYATTTLPQSTTVDDWLTRIHSLAQADVDAGSLPPFYRLDLRIEGNVDFSLPGASCP